MPPQYNMELYELKAELCKTFADPKRLMIIEELRNGEKAVGDLVKALGIAQSAVSRHLAILRDRGVVKSRRDGTSVFYGLTDFKICEACDLVHRILLDQVKKNKDVARRLSNR